MYFPQRESQLKVVVKQSHVLCDPMDGSPPGSSAHGILQTRILERLAISFSRESSRPRDRTRVPALAVGRWILYHGATWEAQAHLRVYQMRPYRGKQLFVLIFIGVCCFTMLY